MSASSEENLSERARSGDDPAAGAKHTDGDAVLRTLPLDRYRDYRPVGEGGMGVVFWALDTDLNREIALKIVRPDAAGTAERVTPDAPIGIAPPARDTPASKAFETLKARFLQEAWVTGGMAHPGIVPVYELGQTPDGIPYYTMRFVKGNRTLASAIDEVRERSMEDRLSLLEPFLKVCDAISYAHARGVIHRDIKPENVALGEFGEVVVLDWGLAKTREGPEDDEGPWQERIREYRESNDLRTLAGALGTPGYMSPEAALGQAADVDERSDVYSLGTILFQILTGRLPFEFQSFIELVRQLRTEDPPGPGELVPETPVGLSDLCVRALSRDPGDRPASAEVLAREVRDWQARRAEDLEIAGLLREARGAIEGADGLRGADLLRPLDRAGAACSRVLSTRPGDAAALAIGEEIDRLRERAAAEREQAARGRILRRGGVAVLIIATLVTIVFAAALESRRRRAEDAERVAARERDEKDAAFRRAEGLRLAAESRAVLAADAGLALTLAVEAGKLHRGPQVLNALQGAIRHHRGEWALPGRGSPLRISPDSRFLVARDGRDTRVIDLETREVAVHLIEHRPAGFSTDASLMATARGSGVSVWNTRTWAPVTDIETGKSFPGADLSPDGAYVLTRGDGKGRDVTLWDVRTGRLHRTLEGHSGEIEDAKFSDDGARLLTVSPADRTTRVWDVSTGAALLVIRGEDADVNEVGLDGRRDSTASAGALFTTDGSRIVTLSANGAIRVWDAVSGERLEKLEGISRYVFPLLRAKDRDRFLIATLEARSAEALVWEPLTGRRIALRPSAGIRISGQAAAISADGRRVLEILSPDRVMRIFNADSGEEVRTLPDAQAVEFSPDGRWIASASRDDEALRLWGARTREESRTLDLTRHGGIESAWLSGDGGRLTTFGQGDRTALVRDVETGRIRSMQTIHDGSWGRPSPDGSVAVLWPGRRPGRLAEVSTGRTLTDLGSPVSLEALAWSHDGRLFAGEFRLHSVSINDLTRVVETDTGRVVADIPTGTDAAAFDRTGHRIAFARSESIEGTNEWARRVEVYDLEAGETLWFTDLPPGEPLDGIAFDAGANRLAAWSWHDALVFDVGTRKPRWATRIGAAGGLRWVGLSAGGKRVAILADTLRVFDVATGDLAFSVPRASEFERVVRWSPRARRLLTADRDGVARVRDGDTGEVLTTLRGHEMPLLSAEYSADGGRIVTVSFDQTAKVWDAVNGRELLSVGGHANERVSDFRFLPETGDVLVVTSCRRAEVRDPADWARVARFPEPVRSFSESPASSLLLSTDGALLASMWGGTVWSARTGERVSHSWTDADRKRFTAMRGRSSPDGGWRLDFRNDRNGREDESRVQVLDSVTGERRAVLEGHAASVTSARFGPAGRLVVTASVDRTAKVWDSRTGAEIMSLDHSDEVRDAAISPDGTFLVTLSEGKLRRFPMDPFAVAASLGPRPLTAAERRRFEIGEPAEAKSGPTARAEPNAGLRLYESLLEELGAVEKVRERLASDDTLEPAAREAARKVRLRAVDHARRLQGRAWRIVVLPGKTPDEYGEALRWARSASRLDPDDPGTLAVLAKATIRTGSAQEGVALLERLAPARAAATGHGVPTDFAFLAIGYASLGRTEKAREALTRYRSIMKHADYGKPGTQQVLVTLLGELEALVK